jgi:hypothetical protein
MTNQDDCDLMIDEFEKGMELKEKQKTIWEHILDSIEYKQGEEKYITGDQIKECKSSWKGVKNQFEPRLLCKQDSEEKRPEIFKKYGINILSVKNGTYLLTKENIYIPLPKFFSPPEKVKKISDSLLLEIGDSETSMLDNLNYNGVLEKILGEGNIKGPFLGGRHRCSFKTTLGDKEIEIKGSQYETDGCYETDNQICLVEAKSIHVNSFNIRQLYYPFRSVYDKVKDKKKITALFVFKDKQSNIHIYHYKWLNPLIMSDIILENYYCFTF